MSWLFLLLFLLGGDFSAPEKILVGNSWLESRLGDDSPAGLAGLVTNETARLDLRLAALDRLERKDPFQAGVCARVLLASPDPVLRVVAGSLSGQASPTDDDARWLRSLRALPVEANLGLLVDYRQAGTLLSPTSLLTQQESDSVLQRGLEQVYGFLHFARIRRFAVAIVTNRDNQPEGGLLLAEGTFSLPALEAILTEAGIAGKSEERDGWKFFASPLARLGLRDDWLVAGFGGQQETMGSLVESWLARLQADSGGADWMVKNARISGGLQLLLSDGALETLLSRMRFGEYRHGQLELRVHSLARGDFRIRLSLPGGVPVALVKKIRAAIAALPERVAGLDASALDWLRKLRVELTGGQLIVRPLGKCDLGQFARLLFSKAGVQ